MGIVGILAPLPIPASMRSGSSFLRSFLLRARATLGYLENISPGDKVYVSHVYYPKHIYLIMIARSLSQDGTAEIQE